LLDELKSVEFSPPREAANSLRFDWQWPREHVLMNSLPRSATRALVISPFVRATFLERLCAQVPIQVVCKGFTPAHISNCNSWTSHQSLSAMAAKPN
jgi:hypothetical protein